MLRTHRRAPLLRTHPVGGMLLDAILQTTSRWPLDRLHGIARCAQPLVRATYRRRVVEDNIRYAFPHADSVRLVREFYAGASQAAVEVLRLLELAEAELRDRVTFEGAEALDEGNAVLLMAHHGNLIWSICALSTVIAAPVFTVYKPPHVDAMDNLLLRLADRFGLTLVPANEIRQQVLKRRQKRPVWTLVADQRPGGRDRHTVRFCGRDTAFFRGPERLARAMKWPVFYLSCQRTAPGRYHCRIEKLADPPHDRGTVVEAYVARLQKDIDQAPADWLWSHRRWRGP